MPRTFNCGSCTQTVTVLAVRGRLPTLCDSCKEEGGGRVRHRVTEVRAPTAPPPKRTPFNSTPTTAPLPSVTTAPAVAAVPVPSPRRVKSGGAPENSTPPAAPPPGPLELQLAADLAALQLTSPGAQTMALVAGQIARAGDLADATDVRAKIAAMKGIRDVLDSLGKSQPGTPIEPAAVLDPDEQAGPFGPCRPELAGEVDLGECEPRWSTRRRLERPTWGPYFGRVAAAMGKPFMPWQQLAADIAGEVDHQGHLCYREFTLTVPRQSGKTTFVLGIAVGRAEACQHFGGRQTMLYAAQTREDAAKKFKQEYIPEVKQAEVLAGKFKARIANGSEGMEFYPSYSTFNVVATKDDSGHGSVLDFGVLDEAFAQSDDAVEGSWVPAGVTRRWFQMMIPSTAGDATSTYFKTKVDAGRRASELDSGYGTAYLEFSADDKAGDFDPGDEAMWRRVMPALGHTITVEVLRSIYQKFVLEGKLNTWLRAFLNVWVDRVSDPIFPAGKWEACCDGLAERATRPIIAIDVAADRKHSTIAMAAQAKDGRTMVRIIDYRPGTEWVVNRVLQLREEYEIIEIIADSIGPVRSLMAELENEYVEVRQTTTNELTAACGQLYDAVKAETIVHFGDPSLELAVVNAETRVLLDAWAWARRKSEQETSTDISPLVACTLAHWGQVKFGDDIHDIGGW